MNKSFRYEHIYSSVKDKAPSASTLYTGEIAVNGNADKPQLFIKDSSGDVRSFYSDYIVELTQADYDQLVEDDEIDPRLFYVITDAEPSEGKIYDAGRAIKISSGTSADTIDFDLPIYSGTGDNAIEICDSGNTASGSHSVAEGKGTTASGYFSHSEGQATTASGTHSHSEGYGTTASGNKSHSEGEASQAKGTSSHAEGYGSIASGTSSHAEGQQTTAKANYSHSEGYLTEANGEASHSSGEFTKANNKGELASGIYNVSTKNDDFFGDSGNTLFSLGNGGNNSTRHNAFEVKEDGSVYYADLSGGTNYYDRPMLKLQDEFEKKMDKQSFINSLYPKGSIYITENNTNPSSFLGGTWELINVDGKKTTLWSGDTTAATVMFSQSMLDFDLIELCGSGEFEEHSIFSPQELKRIGANNYVLAGSFGTNTRYLVIENISSDFTSLSIRTAGINCRSIIGINLGLEGATQFVWKRTDDGIIVESFSAVTLEIQKDVLWEGSATNGNISLSGKMSDYDEIEVVYKISDYTLSNIVTPDEIIGKTHMFTYASDSAPFIYFNNTTDTGFTLVTQAYRLVKVVGRQNAYVSKSLEIEDEITQYSTNNKAAGAAAVYNLMGGMKLVKISQTDYDNLPTPRDPNTLFIISD